MLFVNENYSSIAVIITCHRYEHFLKEAIDSVVSQSVVPSEIVVVNDFPKPDLLTPYHVTECERIINEYNNIKLIDVEYNDPLLARKAGFDATNSECVCFLDADDKLGPGYIENALRLINTTDIVYSDVQYFGDVSKKTDFPENTSPRMVTIGNFLHVGCVTKRDIIRTTRAFDHPEMENYHEDWYFWRKIITAGFATKKQCSLYYAREHDRNRSKKINRFGYYQSRGTCNDVITICDISNSNSIGSFAWKKTFKQPLQPHFTKLDIVNHAFMTSWSDYLFFYNGHLEYDEDICGKLLLETDEQTFIVHDSKYQFLECTMMPGPIFRGCVLTSVDQLFRFKVKNV